MIYRGLGSFRSRIFLLRDELHFRPSVYYAAVFIDFLARLGWALVISPQQPYLQQHFILLLAALEISRRCMWAVFRVEWEYVKNMRSSSTLRSGAVVAQSQAAQMSEKLYSVPQTDDSTDKLPGIISNVSYIFVYLYLV